MKLTVSEWNVKIFTKEDVVPLISHKCLKNEVFLFQVFAEADEDFRGKIEINSDLEYACYRVEKVKGDYYLDKEKDDYYVYAKDDMYPELLKKTDEIALKSGETAALFFELPSLDKPEGKHVIKIAAGGATAEVDIEVLPEKLRDADIILTNWFHYDGICNYYGLKPFSEKFYATFRNFLTAYAKMGNNMILVPAFTPALDTEVGGERLTTQLVKITKRGDEYDFDFSEFDKVVGICKEAGIKYFELSHLFTQWGGKACPKIVATENGEEKKIFGWKVDSTDEKYLAFLKQYFAALAPHLEELGISGETYMHLTDEPNKPDLDNYVRLSEFVRENNRGIKTLDAMSHYELVEQNAVTLPVVSLNSADFDKFSGVDRMVYYCIGVDENYIANRYFHMPLQRTEVLGMQLYDINAKGFLHWGFNFYNSYLSVRALNPYEETTADGHFCAGDAFIVYPGENGVEYSLRYFAMLKAFEEYRLLKTLESKSGREYVCGILHEYGLKGIHDYPRSAEKHSAFVEKVKGEVAGCRKADGKNFKKL